VSEASGIDLLNKMHRIIPKRRAEFLKIPSCVRGTWDAEVIDELQPAKADHLVVKRRDSAFQDTELELWLRSIRIDTLIFTGVDTSICVENSIRDAFNSGFDVIVVEDATASSWPELHNATMMKVRGSFGLVVTTQQLITMLHSSKQRTASFRFNHDLVR
jgi:ureidoacrylate peracid hydrolase